MLCETIRTAISAELDGEDPGVARPEVDEHLFTCAPCREFAHEATRLHPRLRLAAAAEVPDLTDAVLHATGARPAADRTSDDRVLLLRWCLVLLAAIQLAAAVPALVLGDDAGIPPHLARHLGSFTVALAVGLIVVAVRPQRAVALLPVMGALVLCLVGTSVADVLAGHAVAGTEVTHIPELAGLVAMWFVARAVGAAPPDGRVHWGVRP